MLWPALLMPTLFLSIFALALLAGAIAVAVGTYMMLEPVAACSRLGC